MSLHDFALPTLVPTRFREQVWPAFEADVLAYLDLGFQHLLCHPYRSMAWRERHFTWALLRILENIDDDRWKHLSPRYDDRPLTDEDFIKGASPQDASLIDLVIRRHHRQQKPCFCIEAKILVEQRIGSYKPWDTVHEYVKEGMSRFVTGDYATGMPAAAMLGYILIGDPSNTAKRINDRISKLPLRHSTLLTPLKSELQNRHIYTSDHPRDHEGPIKLIHVLLVFEALENTSLDD